MASIVKTSKGKVPARAIQYYEPGGKRRTIGLGKSGLEVARRFKGRVEALLSSAAMGQMPDMETIQWLSGLPDEMHQKLADNNLVAPREPAPVSPTLDTWLTKYIGQRKADLKPESIKKLNRTAELLKEYFTETAHLDAITPNEAKDWRAWLAARGLAEATVRLHCRNAKSMLTEAVERELIDSNPFRKLTSRSIAGTTDRYVTPADTAKIIEEAPSVAWRTLIGLARYAGLRTPSETHILRWADIRWDEARMSVYAPKTERYEQHRRRLVPIVPKLMRILQDAFDAADEGAELVLPLSRNNLHRTIDCIIERAGLSEIRRPFQVMRGSCDTEWKQHLPGYAVDRWLGHSKDVSESHYLSLPDELWARASSDAPDDSSAAAGAATGAAVGSCIELHGVEIDDDDKTAAPNETTCFLVSNDENRDGPGGTRTPDKAIMSRRL